MREIKFPPVQEPVAWRITDGDMGWNFDSEEPELFSVDWAARYGRKHEPLVTLDQLHAYARPILEQRDELAEALREAVDDIESWAEYADEYFKKKHKLSEVLAHYRAILAKQEKTS